MVNSNNRPLHLNQIPKGAAVILANSTLHATPLASYWRKKGIEVVIISIDGNTKSEILKDGTYKLFIGDYEPKWTKVIRYGPMKYLARFERRIFASRSRTQRILGPYPYQAAMRFVGFGISVAYLVRKLQPSFVFAQQVVRFGFAASLCHPYFPTVAMPYGQDIYQLALSSWPLRRLTKWSLRRFDLICPASSSAVSHIVREFEIDESKIRGISWGVDRRLFYPADQRQRLKLRTQYGIPMDALVVMDVRRFALGWGSQVVTEVFNNLIQKHKNYYFIIIGEPTTESDDQIDRLRAKIESSGCSNHFVIFERGVSLSTFSELLMLSDISASLMLGSDMRSSSILEGIAAGTAPVVTEWPEYRQMEQLGFRALFVPINDVNRSVEAIEYYRENPSVMQEIITANLEYIAKYEDSEQQMELLLHTINTVVRNR